MIRGVRAGLGTFELGRRARRASGRRNHVNLHGETSRRGKELLGRELCELRQAGSGGHGLGALGVARLEVIVGDWGSRGWWAPD